MPRDWDNEPRIQLGGGQLRRWAFTLNNWTNDELERLRSLDGNVAVRYLICGAEVGDSGTPHLQGYVEFTRPKRIRGVKDLLGSERFHVEPAFADAQANTEYCEKEGNVLLRFGSAGGSQGKRTDLDRAAELVRSGARAIDVLEAHPATFIKYHRGLERAIQLYQPRRRWITQCIWRYGDSGSGKSRDTRLESENFYGDRVCWVRIEKGHFFNGFEAGCKGVVLDEFDGTLGIADLLSLLDSTPHSVPVKGSFQQWNPRILWITSQYAPEHYYSEGPQWPALARRLAEFAQVLKYEFDLNWETNRREKRITERNYDQ